MEHDADRIKQFYRTFMGHPASPGADAGSAVLPSVEYFTYPQLSREDKLRMEEFRMLCRELEDRSATWDMPDLNHCKADYAGELNEAQLRVVTMTRGPVLVIAGAGTGKTRTISYRAAYMIEQGADPRELLLLTFTRKAAREMIDRTAALLEDADVRGKVSGGTFHGFANQMLRTYADMLSIDRNFTILDDVDALDLVTLIRDELKLKKREHIPVPRSREIHGVISRSRACGITVREVIEGEHDYLLPYLADIEVIFKLYGDYKKSHRQYDYDDLLEVFYRQLCSHAPFCRKIHDRFRSIIVDEYQDTSLIQGKIVEALAGNEQNVMVVGDDTQSIYSFRGARYENIIAFPRMFPSCRIVKLEENYRSTEQILEFTNSIIASMGMGYAKTLFSRDGRPSRPEVHRFAYRQDEASWVCDAVEAFHEEGHDYRETAVLFRAQYLADFIQAEMLKRRIPFVVYGGLRFTERRHIKDMLAYLRIVHNPLDGSAWNRILKLLPDIGSGRASFIIRTIMANGGHFSAASFSSYRFASCLKALEKALAALGDDRTPLSRRLLELKAYYLPILRTLETDSGRRAADLDVLSVLAEGSDSIESFLSDLALDPPGSAFQEGSYGEEEGTKDHVVLSTIHSAKGLEWSHVFIVSMLDGIFPDARSVHAFQDLEEERRLFYVAATRAKHRLMLTFPSAMQSYGTYFSLPSRFISEVEAEKFTFYVSGIEAPVSYL